jgi:hypothetical protein
MTISAADKIKQQGPEQLARIAKISMDIRQAVRDALPAPAEQFFTMMVPGKVLNFDDFTTGFDLRGKAITPTTPISVQLAEAILCDDMPALSGVQLGPTGRSVARSYAATLSKLCPAGSTTGIDDDIDEGNLSEPEQRYRRAMIWLTSNDPNNPGQTRVEMYRRKQKAYTDAFEQKTKAFNLALDTATKDPTNTTIAMQRAAYDVWVSQNQKTYRNLVQAAYMDWVTVGKKEEAEYWFAIVDNDSAMSRVEASKEAMRASTVSDVDGSAEYQKVSLTPSNWAWLAKQKADQSAPGENAESLTWKISRLQKVNLLLKAMAADPTLVMPAAGEAPPPESADTTVTDFLTKNSAYQAAYTKYQGLVDSKKATDEDKTTLQAAQTALDTARDALTTHFADMDKKNIGSLNAKAQKAMADLFAKGGAGIQAQVTANDDAINKYQHQLDNIQGTTTAVDVQNDFATDAGIPPAPPAAAPVAAGAINQADYWTSIAVEVSSSYNASQSDSSSNSYSVGGGASWGLWSVGGSASHSDSSANAAAQMANSSIKATFDCMRVDITRNWLRGELFYDDDLKVAPKNYISPGPIILAGLMDPDTYEVSEEAKKLSKEEELATYDQFPMYPTSFLLAANVVLEIEGETSDIQSHFHTSTTTASGSVGWGPFSVSSSYSHTDTQASSSCEATASGCRIRIKSPQIIGWISQIVPALPRVEQKPVNQ